MINQRRAWTIGVAAALVAPAGAESPRVSVLDGRFLADFTERHVRADLERAGGLADARLVAVAPALPETVSVPSGRRSRLRVSWRWGERRQDGGRALRATLEVHVDGLVVRSLPVGFEVVPRAPSAEPAPTAEPPAARAQRPAPSPQLEAPVGDAQVTLVRRGDRVSVTVRKGGLAVVASGVVDRDGGEHQRVAVQIAGRPAPLPARVVGAGQVEVVLGRGGEPQ